MLARRSAWSDDEVVRLARDAVPVADDEDHLRGDPFFEAVTRAALAQASPGDRQMYSSAMGTRGLWQGSYLVAPDGELLAWEAEPSRAKIEAMLRRGLARWHARKPDGWLDGGAEAIHRALPALPPGGLALTLYDRDLSISRGEIGHGANWNVDHVWFRAGELASLRPAALKPGARAVVPALLVQRLARTALLDTVNGLNFNRSHTLTPRFLASDVEAATMQVEVTALRGDEVQLRYTGKTRTESRRIAPTRGMALELLGHATFDRKQQRFVAFELVAVGTRWGNSFDGHSNDDRGSDVGPAPIGFALVAAQRTPADALPPFFLDDYGWK